jgi:hypothetical protein
VAACELASEQETQERAERSCKVSCALLVHGWLWWFTAVVQPFVMHRKHPDASHPSCSTTVCVCRRLWVRAREVPPSVPPA